MLPRKNFENLHALMAILVQGGGGGHDFSIFIFLAELIEANSGKILKIYML